MASWEAKTTGTSPEYSSVQGQTLPHTEASPDSRECQKLAIHFSWHYDSMDVSIVEITACETAFLHLLRPCSQHPFRHFLYPNAALQAVWTKQLIMGPVHEFGLGPLSQNFVDNLTGTWPRRTILRHIDYNGDLSTDDQYKEWIQLQQNERNDFLVFRRTRELQLSSACQGRRRQN